VSLALIHQPRERDGRAVDARQQVIESDRHSVASLSPRRGAQSSVTLRVVHVVAFVGVCLVVVLTPGVDMALVTKNALLHGRAAAQATAWGVNVGIVFWTVAAALGLAALVAAPATAFDAIKLAGAVY